MIVILDYGMGNLGSILNMLKKIGAKAVVSSNTHEIQSAEKLILPGVGAFETGMFHLKEFGMVDLLNEKVLNQKTPTLGICLGMQLLTKRSEEGALPGLGWIDGETIRFQFDPVKTHLKIPHMGWNTVTIHKEGGLFKGFTEEARFYFVHSYHVVCNRKVDILTTTHHGYNFVSAIQRENIMGTQFHPEKSHKYGMKVLKNFVDFV